MTQFRSSYLFQRPSFLDGMARVLDIGGVYNDYNYSLTPEEADTQAMAVDWLCVGDDIVAAINQHKVSRTK